MKLRSFESEIFGFERKLSMQLIYKLIDILAALVLFQEIIVSAR